MADTISGNIYSTTSLNLNSSATSAIDYFGDTDWWRVSLPDGYGYQVWIEGSQYANGTLRDPYLAIYNSAGTVQLNNDDYSYLIYDAYLYATPTSTGTFFLSAEESGNNGTGSYTITIWQDQLASVATVATVAINGSVSDRIGWQDDTSDWYAVSLTAGIQYQFDLLGSTSDGSLAGLTLADPWLALRNNSGTSLLVDDDSGLGSNSRIFFTPSMSGTYYMDAQESGVDASGIYRLIVNSTPTAGALSLDSAQAGTIGFAGDVDLYSVYLTAGVTYSFSVDGNTLTDPFLEVISSNGDTLDYDDDNGSGLNAYLTFSPTTSGTYYLAARDSGNNATGSYSVLAYELPRVSIANATVVEGDSGTSNLVFTISLSTASSIPVSVTAATSGTSTATYSSDYIPASATITFAAGQTSANFTVQVLGDTIFEPREAFHVLLSSPTNAILGDSSAYGFIRDNDNPYSLPSDSLADLQWYLYPTTGINVFPVWDDYTGDGVRVAVFDQGIDPNNPDLDGNLSTSLGRIASNLSAGGAPILSTDNHGTAVAGTIAAERDGSGIVGVAYGADLVSIYSPLSYSAISSTNIASAYTYAANFDVLNDSWGFALQGYSYSWEHWAFYDNFQTSSFSAAGTALANLALTGRNGLGTVVVQSAGNSFNYGDDTNLHNFQNSQYIITVAATDYSGNVTSYSSLGASVLVAAPGGGSSDDLSKIITTDRVGAAGYEAGNYTDIVGTSFSAPIVSGVVALMLEANPNLGYRDVQEILAYSARETSSASNDWRYNGASNWNSGGLHYDALEHNLGFGLVDARAAVRLAETWSSTSHIASNRQQVTLSHSAALFIPDNTGYSAFDSIAVSQAIDVERVEVTLNVTHPFIGDLSVLLTSPTGTSSFLLWRPQQNPLSAYGTAQNDIHFTFDTVLDWGESSLGTWGLGIYDYAFGDVGRFDSWTLNLIGKPASADDCYIYTDEFAEACADQAARSTLSDTGGNDTLNAAACTSNLALNLGPGGVSSIDSRSLTISSGTLIENAYGGDGNDIINGNSVANILYGCRGDDRFDGGGDNDTLYGGAGNDTLDGSTGNDTAVFAGLRSIYVITATSNGFTATSTAEGTDTLTNMEFAQFSDQTITLTTDNIPPVATFSPSDDTTNVAISSNIVLTFSEAIQRGTGNIVLKNSAGTVIETFNAATSGNLSISDSTLTINPTSDLSYITGYKVEFASGTIKDLAGNSYVGTTEYNFTTIAAPDTTPPVAPKLVTNAAFNFVIDPQLTMQTTLGTVVIELNPEKAPITVANMLAYVDSGFYDNTLFHRVISNFMVQGGGLTTGLVAKTPTYGAIALESNNGLSNLRGTIAMARTSVADSATTQFFVNQVDNTYLNYSSAASPGYAVFGSLVSGLSVIDSIAQVPTNTIGPYANVPVTDVTITSLRQTLSGSSITNSASLTVSGLETGAQWSYTLDSGANWTAGTGSSFAVPVGNYAASAIQVRQTDAAGNLSTTTGKLTSALVVETTAPTVSTFSPTDDTTNVAISSNILLTFSEAVQRGTGSIVLKNVTGTVIETFNTATSSNLSIAGSTLTINPASDLSYGTGYKVEFTSGTIKDLAGNSYVGTTEYNFTTVEATTAPGDPTNAKIFLGADGDSFNVSNSEATLYGNTGTDIVTISTGVSGVTLDQNVERINFSGLSSIYKFNQTGNIINVYDASDTLMATAPVQDDNDGTFLSFSNGMASTKLAGGVMKLGDTTVNSNAASVPDTEFTSDTASPQTSTKAKVFLGSDDSFTVGNSGATLYGNTGTDAVTILASVSGVTLDQNVERVNFSGLSSAYKFMQTGNIIKVYNAADNMLLASAPVQDDSNGTQLSFSGGVPESAILANGVMTLGSETVSDDSPAPLSLVGIAAADISLL